MAGKFIDGIFSKIKIDTSDIEVSKTKVAQFEKEVLLSAKRTDQQQIDFKNKFKQFVTKDYLEREALLKTSLNKELEATRNAYKNQEISAQQYFNFIKKSVAQNRQELSSLNKQTQSGGFSSGPSGIFSQGANVSGWVGVIKSAFGSISSIVNDFIDKSNQAESAIKGLSAVVGNRLGGEAIPAATKAMKELVDTGLMNEADAAQSIKNLVSMGYSIDDTTKLLKANLNIAVDNRQSHYSLSESVKVYTEGLKNQNSVLSDATGISENISLTLKKQGMTMEDLSSSTKGAAARQVLLNAHLNEAAAFFGRADEAANSYTGLMAKLNVEIDKVKAEMGAWFKEELTDGIPILISIATEVKNVIASFRHLYNTFSSWQKEEGDAISWLIGKLWELSTIPFKAIANGVKWVVDEINKWSAEEKAREIQSLTFAIAGLEGTILDLERAANAFKGDKMMSGLIGPALDAAKDKLDELYSKIENKDQKTGKPRTQTPDFKKSSDSLAKLMEDLRKFNQEGIDESIKKVADLSAQYDKLIARVYKFWSSTGYDEINKLNKTLERAFGDLIRKKTEMVENYYISEDEKRLRQTDKEYREAVKQAENLFELQKKIEIEKTKLVFTASKQTEKDKEDMLFRISHIEMGTDDAIINHRKVLENQLSQIKDQYRDRQFKRDLEIINEYANKAANVMTGLYALIEAKQQKSMSGFLSASGQIASQFGPQGQAVGGILSAAGIITGLFEKQKNQTEDVNRLLEEQKRHQEALLQLEKDKKEILDENYETQLAINKLTIADEKLRLEADRRAAEQRIREIMGSGSGSYFSEQAAYAINTVPGLSVEESKLLGLQTEKQEMFNEKNILGPIIEEMTAISNSDPYNVTRKNNLYDNLLRIRELIKIPENKNFIDKAIEIFRAQKDLTQVSYFTGLSGGTATYGSFSVQAAPNFDSQKDIINDLIKYQTQIVDYNQSINELATEQSQPQQQTGQSRLGIDKLIKDTQFGERLEQLQTAENQQTTQQELTDRLSLWNRLKDALIAMAMPVLPEDQEALETARILARENIAKIQQELGNVQIDQTVNNTIVEYRDNGTYLDRREWVEDYVFKHLENFANKINRTILARR